MNNGYDKIKTCLASVREKTDFVPEVALILGSGLGDYADQIKIETTIDYTDIEGFPTSTVAGHKGRFVFGYVNDVPVVIMQGRVHFYEGYPMTDVVLPTRLMGMMGAKKLVLTNAAGGVNLEFKPGDFMLITDHINMTGKSPLTGKNDPELGTRFPDMTFAYSHELGEKAMQAAADCGLKLHQGVYCGVNGPQFETPAEIRMFRTLGADAVGMSTVFEVIAAAHCGLPLVGIAMITNMAAGVLMQPLSGAEVNETAERRGAELRRLVAKLLEKI